jgi:hypothetical protein
VSLNGLEMVEPDAESRLAKFRATYEPFLGGVAEYLMVGLPKWIHSEEQLDNWEEDERGATAKRLVEAVIPGFMSILSPLPTDANLPRRPIGTCFGV